MLFMIGERNAARQTCMSKRSLSSCQYTSYECHVKADKSKHFLTAAVLGSYQAISHPNEASSLALLVPRAFARSSSLRTLHYASTILAVCV